MELVTGIELELVVRAGVGGGEACSAHQKVRGLGQDKGAFDGT